MKRILIYFTILFTVGCSKEELVSPDVTPTKNAVFICNEGNFMYGNASLSVYDPAEKSAQNQVFFNTNNFPLGDVCQSMTIIGNHGFLVINNSGKVVVIDIDTYKYVGTIKGLTSPRYIEVISDEKIYISDLYSRSIAIANPKTFEVTGYVNVKNSTEQMVKLGNFVYACSWSFNNQVYKIDTKTDKVVDSLTVAKQPNSMVLDKHGKIWVLSDGGYIGSPYIPEIAALTRIDAVNFKLEKRFDFPNMDLSPSELCINHNRDTLFYISGGWGSNTPTNGIHRMEVTETELSKAPLIKENGAIFYALGIDPNTSEIYVSDAIDYIQRGTVMRFDSHGREIDRFKVDIIPGTFCFK